MDDSIAMLMNPRKLSSDDIGDPLSRVDEVRLLSSDGGSSFGDPPGMSGADDDGDDDDDEEDEEDDDDDEEEEEEEVGGPSVRPRPPFRPAMTPQQAREEAINAKRELLYRFDRLERKGVRLPRRYSMASDLLEMQADYERLVRDRDADSGIRFQKKILLAFVSGVEFMNRKFDPFDFHLDGWGETVNENLTDYDDVLEELHQKYKGTGKMAPELKLVMMVVGSAFMYHLTNTMFKNAPALGQVVKDNPDLMKQFAAATANTMQKSDNTGMAGIFSSMFGGGGGGAPQQQQQQQPPPPPPPPQQQQQQQQSMRGPSPSRIAEVQRFIKQQQQQKGQAARRAPMSGPAPVPYVQPPVRPPLPAGAREAVVPKEAPRPAPPQSPPPPRQPSNDLRGDDDIMEIMSVTSDASGATDSTQLTAGGTRRRRGKRATLSLE